MNLNNQDHETILAYLTARLREAGYKGACFICVDRLAQIHLSHSKFIVSEAIAKMKVA